MKDPRLVSLVKRNVPRDPRGLCSKRFQADYETDGLDYATLSPGDTVLVAGRRIYITQVGKRCHPECPLPGRGKSCELKQNCAFGREAE